MLIDSHAHIFYEDYKDDLQTVVQRALDAGIEAIVVPGTTLQTSREAIELAEKFSFVYAATGIHPHEASSMSDTAIAELESLSTHPRVVAIGEIGLDFHYDFSPRDVQLRVFKQQIELAIRKDLPIIVHTRESIPESIAMVKQMSEANSGWRKHLEQASAIPVIPRGVFHCFTGSAGDVAMLNSSGFYCSYPGIVTFKNSPVAATLRATGFERILLETDSPYLTPVPYRGQRNEPAYVKLVAEKLAEMFSVPLEKIAQTTSANARRLFNLNIQ